MIDITYDPGFWQWISKRQQDKDVFKPIPLHIHVDIPEKSDNIIDNNNASVVIDVDHTVYQF